MILMILAWFYLPRAFDFWALYAEIKKKWMSLDFLL